MAIGLDSLSGIIPTNFSFSSYTSILLWGGIIAIVVGFAAYFIHMKLKYVYFAEVFRRRQDEFGNNLPTASILSGKAGYFTKKGGKNVFKIKYGKAPWQKIELSKLPDPKYMIGNKVVYLQLNKDNLVQAKVGVDWLGEYNLQPVEDDLKYGAQLDITEKSMILEQKKLSSVTVGIIVMGLIIITGIIVFYFLGKA